MDITPRQREFLTHLLDLYHEMAQPIHYTAVAEKFGVSKWSAYDMLNLLERKGLVKREYVVDNKGGGRGRSTVVFGPTPQAEEMLAALGLPNDDQEEWEAVRERILANLQTLQGAQHVQLLEELLQSVPKRTSPLPYCAELLTALLLSIDNVKQHIKEIPFLRNFSEGRHEEPRLMTLGGLGLGLSLGQGVRQEVARRWEEWVRKYEAYVQKMDQGRQRVLCNFVREVVVLLSLESPESTRG